MASLEALDGQLKAVILRNKPSSSAVEAIVSLALENLASDTALITLLYRHHKKSAPANKLTSLYLVDAIARAARSKYKKDGKLKALPQPDPASTTPKDDTPTVAPGTSASFLKKLEGLVSKIVLDVWDNAPSEYRDKVRKVVDIWTKAGTFSSATLARLSSKLVATSAPAEPNAAAPFEMSPIAPAMSPTGPSASPGPQSALPATSDAHVPIPANVLALLQATAQAEPSAAAREQQKKEEEEAMIQRVLLEAQGGPKAFPVEGTLPSSYSNNLSRQLPPQHEGYHNNFSSSSSTLGTNSENQHHDPQQHPPPSSSAIAESTSFSQRNQVNPSGGGGGGGGGSVASYGQQQRHEQQPPPRQQQWGRGEGPGANNAEYGSMRDGGRGQRYYYDDDGPGRIDGGRYQDDELGRGERDGSGASGRGWNHNDARSTTGGDERGWIARGGTAEFERGGPRDPDGGNGYRYGRRDELDQQTSSTSGGRAPLPERTRGRIGSESPRRSESVRPVVPATRPFDDDDEDDKDRSASWNHHHKRPFVAADATPQPPFAAPAAAVNSFIEPPPPPQLPVPSTSSSTSSFDPTTFSATNPSSWTDFVSALQQSHPWFVQQRLRGEVPQMHELASLCVPSAVAVFGWGPMSSTMMMGTAATAGGGGGGGFGSGASQHEQPFGSFQAPPPPPVVRQSGQDDTQFYGSANNSESMSSFQQYYG